MSTTETETIELAENFLRDGLTLGTRGLCDDALDSLDQAIVACETFKGDSFAVRTLAAQALSNKGAALGDLDRHKEAVKCYDAAIAIYRELSDQSDHEGLIANYAVAVMNMGWSFLNLGRQAAGFQCLEESLALRRRLVANGNQTAVSDVARSLYNIGEGYFRAKQFAKAVPAFDEASNILWKLIAAGHREHEEDFAYVLAAQADTFQKLDRLEEAQTASTEAITLFVKLAGGKRNPKLASALAAALDGREIISQKLNKTRTP